MNQNDDVLPLKKLPIGSKLLGRYLYCQHALQRMAERSFSYKDIEETINKGNRYNTLEGRQLCTNLNRHLGVIFDQKTETVVTVIPLNLKGLEFFLNKRDNASLEEKKEAFKRKRKLNALSTMPKAKDFLKKNLK